MKNIQILLLKKCHNLTDNGVREIAKLLHLTVNNNMKLIGKAIDFLYLLLVA